jgi:uncharacterized protein (TIGR00255 family)
MTGYGRGQGQTQGKLITVEMKAVNHRFSEVVIRQPKQVAPLEDRLRKLVLTKINRGRVDVFVTIESYGEEKKVVKVDKELAMAYYNGLKELGDVLSLPKDINLVHISGYHGVFTLEEPEEDLEDIWVALNQAGQDALTDLVKMRVIEGEKLKEDIRTKLNKISDANNKIEERSPKVVLEYKEKLTSRIHESLKNVEVDEARLAMEVAVFADRGSVEEEIVRLNSHLQQMNTTLESDEAIGRKLDFIVQEMNREINTIGSKANDLTITNMVVDVKSEIEKIREQVQNIE